MITKLACWEVECDVDKTSELYAEFEGPSCRCGYCRNFGAAMDSAFPQDFKLLASRLGMDVAMFTWILQPMFRGFWMNQTRVKRVHAPQNLPKALQADELAGVGA